MIKINETYSINGGQGTIVFSEGKKGTVNASYEIKGKKDTGVINGTLDGNVLNGTYHNKIGNSSGLIQFVFTENGFDCKWKQGLEPGPMRGKWEGAFKDNILQNTSFCNESESILFKLEISSIEEYDINYGSFFTELNVDKNILNDFRNNCNYNTIVTLVNSVLNNNISEILRIASSEINIEELKSEDYDWWSYSPCVKVLKIDELDLEPIYRVYNNEEEYNSDAARLLNKDEDEISDYVSDFMTDVAFHIEKEIFPKSI